MAGDDAHGEEITKWDNYSKEGPKLTQIFEKIKEIYNYYTIPNMSKFKSCFRNFS